MTKLLLSILIIFLLSVTLVSAERTADYIVREGLINENGELSTIVTTHTPGTAITLHRSNTDFIVTEYGIASLRGKTVEERTLALINIAHPKFRKELTKQARDLGYLLKD